ncbi:hypothetical protein VOLCADRAFT_94610 [Volvox carteri f. nagariensis]|uniref:Mitochondrial carrier protein n=1 Tax=Volvox carteri f. nagariensis TaxID=3068 RepID=D8U590_VOLCA|nr:uncharacterized protein VOLCADRAFT_94610 [Volvox carteri f. nagariensis]EFJ45110.1 hypothetical protein VOLCADRAFT_94610 [Volvox carteri f. nagariensis]|eukprot:XP_002953786.1 hypothetical protein VOLCADRAFT_94610 [Volvox carteri f. nagariensis]
MHRSNRHQPLNQPFMCLVSARISVLLCIALPPRARWLPVVRAPFPVPGSYQGALGTLAAGCLWSGVFGSVYVPVRAAVEATNASEAPSDTQHYHHQRPCWSPAVAAAAGSLAASCVRVPLQVVKDRMERKQFFCSLQAFERILVLEGLSSLYIGWTRSVAKNLPFDALLFLLYDTGKSLLAAAKQPRRLAQSHPHHHHQHQPAEQAPAAAEAEPPYKFWEAAAIGGMAGAAASLLTSPLELLSPPSAISLWARNHDGGTRAGNLTGAAAVVRGIKGWDGCSAGDACQRTMHLTNKSSGGGSGVHVPPRGTSLPPLGHVARDLFPPAMGSLDGASVGAHSSPTAAAALPSVVKVRIWHRTDAGFARPHGCLLQEAESMD